MLLAHVSIQCADPSVSRAFYEAVLAPLGGQALSAYGDHVGFGRPETGPDFWIGPVNTPGGPHDDVHLAFVARSRAEVEAFVGVARSRGAEVLHEPKEWWYSPGYYGGCGIRTGTTWKPCISAPPWRAEQRRTALVI